MFGVFAEVWWAADDDRGLDEEKTPRGRKAPRRRAWGGLPKALAGQTTETSRSFTSFRMTILEMEGLAGRQEEKQKQIPCGKDRQKNKGKCSGKGNSKANAAAKV
jgi:hypothetical protein